ncbi:distal membrane arm assembly component 2 [Arctopsyche grandis]|uniref:distal membrane arm assembly component 2 n=1 Tax=Arctopsyche grandis TaxID=121162 RepID=UPI00406D8573
MWANKSLQGINRRVFGVVRGERVRHSSGNADAYNARNDTKNETQNIAKDISESAGGRETKRSRGPVVTEEQMKNWREHPEAWRSKLSVFTAGSGNRGILELLAASSTKLTRIWRLRHEYSERLAQQMMPTSHNQMGADLAAANFLYHRGAKIKFARHENWMLKSDKTNKTILPMRFENGWVLEKIDCKTMIKGGMRYEGLDNLSKLRSLTWISLKGNKFIDDWGVDKLTSITYKNLEYLNLAECNITYRGLIALWKIEPLKMLVLSSKIESKEVDIVCSMLEETNPKLLIQFE